MEPPQYNPSVFFGYALDIIFWLCCLYFCIKKSIPNPIRLLKFFAYSNVIVDMITIIGYFVKQEKYFSTIKLISSLALMLEFLFEIAFFTFLLFQVVRSRLAKKISWFINAIAIISMACVIYYILQHKRNLFSYCLSIFTVLQAGSILMLCAVFLGEILRDNPTKGWVTLQTYWVVTGIIFYFSLRIPTFLFSLYASLEGGSRLSDLLFSIYNYSQIVPYALFIKAMTCKNEQVAASP